MYFIQIVDRIVVVSAYVSGLSLASSLSEMHYILFREQSIKIYISGKVEAFRQMASFCFCLDHES
jgi:hypothetical protein